MLNCSIKVYSNSVSSYNNNNSSTKIVLFHESADSLGSARNHYNFGVEPKLIEEFLKPKMSSDFKTKRAKLNTSEMKDDIQVAVNFPGFNDRKRKIPLRKSEVKKSQNVCRKLLNRNTQKEVSEENQTRNLNSLCSQVKSNFTQFMLTSFYITQIYLSQLECI